MDWEVCIRIRSLPWLLLILVQLQLVLGVTQTQTNPVIIEHPEDQYVGKNEPATLNCKAQGDPPPVITWYRNGQPVETANENPASHRMLLPNGQLFFLRIIHNKNNKKDVGVYYCNATNPETKVSVISRNATLEIAVLKDDFKESPRNTDVALGDTAILTCEGPKGLPEPRIKWKKDGDTVRPGGRLQLQDNGNLMIQNTEKYDSGVYVCIAFNIAGEVESKPARLAVLEKPKFKKKPLDIKVDENSDAHFECEATGDPPPTIIWKREDGKIPQGRSEVLADRSLKIRKAKTSDEGVYICRAENSVGAVEEQARLSVHSHPSFIVTPKDKTVGVGRRVSFQCEVTGNPPPAVFWNKDTSQNLMFPRQDHGRFSVADDGTLIIEPVRKDDEGQYVCSALSVAGSALAKARLEVKDVDPRPPPIIHQGPQNQTLPIKSVAVLSCEASGDPVPTIQWLRDGRSIIKQDPRFTILSTGSLQISDLRQSDTGMYTCKASSETGDTVWTAALVVAPSTDHSVIFGRTPEPSTFPGAPSRPSVSDVQDTSVRLTWKANSNHGASPVFAHMVEYFSHETGQGWIVASDSITEHSYVVRSLRPDTPYIFLVRAQNSHGLSMPSDTTLAVRTTGGDFGNRGRDKDLDLNVVKDKLRTQVVVMRDSEVISATAIKVNWEVKRAQKFIEGFHIKYRTVPGLTDGQSHQHHIEHDYTTETVSSPTANTYVLKNLRPHQWYEIRVQPFYGNIQGQESNLIHVQTLEAAPAAPPGNVKTERLGNNTIRLSWTKIPDENLNGDLRGYKIWIYGNETKYNRALSADNGATSLIIDHILPGITYKLQMAAWNTNGDGVKSDPHIIGSTAELSEKSFVQEPWFIGTLITIIGGTLWIVLCVFTVWLCRKRRARKMNKVPVHKSDDPSSIPMEPISPLLNTGTQAPVASSSTNYGNQRYMPPCCSDDGSHSESDPQRPGGYQKLNSVKPDVTNVGDRKAEEAYSENLYNTPNVNPQPPMKTFYNKHNQSAVQPYATTTLLMQQSNAMRNPQPPMVPESAFRPIQTGGGCYGHPQQQGSGGSSDSCVKPELSSDSNNESRSNPGMVHCDMRGDTCEQCGDHLHTPVSDCNMTEGNYYIDEGDPRQQGPNGPVLFLPPPPEHPPPSDIGSPPDSPGQERRGVNRSGYQPVPLHPPPQQYATTPYPPHMGMGMTQQPRGGYSDTENTKSMPSGGHHNRSYSPRAQCNHHAGYMCQNCDPRSQSPPNNNNNAQNRCRTISPRLQQGDLRAYSPRAMSEPERGPTPPVRAYKLVPILDSELHKHYSDTEGAPVPPLRMIVPHPHDSPPSPAPEDPMMDRAIQSSLPSLANENMRLENGHVHPYQYHVDENGMIGYDPNQYLLESDLENNTGRRTPESGDDNDSIIPDAGASISGGEINSDDNCSSVRSSIASSSNGSFFAEAEADFASAVAKAAELSGLTVVGSTVTDPNAGKERERNKQYRKHRERERAKRPTSPYSTDSNYSAVPPHKPYPKSQRKKQIQDKRRQTGDNSNSQKQRPSLKTKPLMSQGSLNSRNKQSSLQKTPSPPTMNGIETNIRTNPMAAFDTTDTPIV